VFSLTSKEEKSLAFDSLFCLSLCFQVLASNEIKCVCIFLLYLKKLEALSESNFALIFFFSNMSRKIGFDGVNRVSKSGEKLGLSLLLTHFFHLK